MNPLRNTFDAIATADYTIEAARYANNKLALRPMDSKDGYTGRAARLINAIAPNARWSGRECAYIISPAQAKKVIAAFERGADATFGTDKAGRFGYTKLLEGAALA